MSGSGRRGLRRPGLTEGGPIKVVPQYFVSVCCPHSPFMTLARSVAGGCPQHMFICTSGQAQGSSPAGTLQGGLVQCPENYLPQQRAALEDWNRQARWTGTSHHIELKESHPPSLRDLPPLCFLCSLTWVQ